MKGIYSVYMLTGFRFARTVVGLRLVVFRLLQIHKTGQQFAHYCIVVSVWYKLHLETDISLIQNYFLTANRSIQRWCVFWDKVHLEASEGERWRIMNEPVFKSCKTRLRKKPLVITDETLSNYGSALRFGSVWRHFGTRKIIKHAGIRHFAPFSTWFKFKFTI